jgi:hypothetical protein
MRSFILACIAGAVIAVIAAVALNAVQQPATIAFSTQGARP